MALTTCSIHSEPHISAADREVVLSGLRAHNRQHAPAPDWTPLNLLLRGSDGRICGGLLGESGWGWLHIHILWVAEAERGQGYGAALLHQAEQEAWARGCRGVHLDTHDFQAPGFYEHCGYEVFGVLENYPQGARRHFLAKTLRGPGAGQRPESSAPTREAKGRRHGAV
jgi:GNAT superfamily N-acetyltransferase